MFKWLYRSSDDILCPVSTVYGWFAKTTGKVCTSKLFINVFAFLLGVSTCFHLVIFLVCQNRSCLNLCSLHANPLAQNLAPQVKLDSDKWKLWKNCLNKFFFWGKFGIWASRWKTLRQRLLVSLFFVCFFSYEVLKVLWRFSLIILSVELYQILFKIIFWDYTCFCIKLEIVKPFQQNRIFVSSVRNIINSPANPQGQSRWCSSQPRVFFFLILSIFFSLFTFHLPVLVRRILSTLWPASV